MDTKRLSNEAQADELSRLLTRERLKHSGVLNKAQTVSTDPDLGSLLDAVRKSSQKAPKAKIHLSKTLLKKLAGY